MSLAVAIASLALLSVLNLIRFVYRLVVWDDCTMGDNRDEMQAVGYAGLMLSLAITALICVCQMFPKGA